MRFHPDMSPWEILGVPEGAPLSAARGRWMKLVRETHPDSTGMDSTEDCVLVNSAFAAVKEYWANPPAEVDVPVDYSTAEPIFPLDDVLAAAAEEALDRLFGAPGEGPPQMSDDDGLFDDDWLDDFYGGSPVAPKNKAGRRSQRRSRGRLGEPSGGRTEGRKDSRTNVRVSDPPAKVGAGRKRRNGVNGRSPAAQREAVINSVHKGPFGLGEPSQGSRQGDVTYKQADRSRRRRAQHGDDVSSPTSRRASQLSPNGALDSRNEDLEDHNLFGAVRRSSLDEARRSAAGRRSGRPSGSSPGLSVGLVIAVVIVGTVVRTILQGAFDLFNDVPVAVVAVIALAAAGVAASIARRFADEEMLVAAVAAGTVLTLAVAELVVATAVPLVAACAVGYAWTRTRSKQARETSL